MFIGRKGHDFVGLKVNDTFVSNLNKISNVLSNFTPIPPQLNFDQSQKKKYQTKNWKNSFVLIVKSSPTTPAKNHPFIRGTALFLSSKKKRKKDRIHQSLRSRSTDQAWERGKQLENDWSWRDARRCAIVRNERMCRCTRFSIPRASEMKRRTMEGNGKGQKRSHLLRATRSSRNLSLRFVVRLFRWIFAARSISCSFYRERLRQGSFQPLQHVDPRQNRDRLILIRGIGIRNLCCMIS